MALALVAFTRSGRTQEVSTPGALGPDGACTYRTCALTIAPRWNGLAVVAGDGGRPVANLHFLLPRDITRALVSHHPELVSGADSAASHARRAVRLRRAGAALTDVGLLLGGAAALYASQADASRKRTSSLAAASGTMLLLSVPLQFAADGALSRAVWWHNVRYAR